MKRFSKTPPLKTVIFVSEDEDLERKEAYPCPGSWTKKNEEMESRLFTWIVEQRSLGRMLTWTSIQARAKTIFNELSPAGSQLFSQQRVVLKDSCPTCGSLKPDNEPLSQTGDQVKTHTGDKPYQCVVCGKAFSQACNVMTHERTHTGEKPYQCDKSGKAFNQASNLVTNQQIHTGEKPYQCNKSGKAFSQASNLVRHMRIHTGEKPHQCDWCHTAFLHVGDLVRHQWTHTGDKPYQCGVCGKVFS